ncbi:PDZ domain-containing protein [Corynebacterium sp. sy017]|uniref:YlbL family protein n=1 Tax=unclassified Corynebacterium TaxID=2624378 RepID=UPI001186ADC6|nr:PDZ domain-containing protein [Corynebacterium sp. SY003]MBP3088762.1 PDZ domain-containing protein [Corynebacterium sp. sy017]TSD92043.1 PDZ domain-containing protein [Corynebacterium sp. SY003]
MKRGSRTLILGAIPLVLLTGLVTIDHIPGTNISLTVPYAAEGTGPTFNTLGEVDGQDVVEISGAQLDDTDGHLNMTTVSVRSNMTLGQALGRWLFTKDTLVPIEQIFPQNMTEEEVKEANEKAFSTSEASATIAAMNYLNLPLSIEVSDLAEDSPAAAVLEQGDEIIAIDDKPVAQPEEIKQAVQAKKPGDSLSVKFKRAGKEQSISLRLAAKEDEPDTAFLGASLVSIPANGVEVTYHLEDVGGPSAGMMFSLAVIDKLSKGSLTGGKFIAGTGTIDADGTVGPIGGIEHKIRAAKEAGAQLFLAPEANCSQARREASGITLASVDNISDAIEQIKAFNEGKEVKTCS